MQEVLLEGHTRESSCDGKGTGSAGRSKEGTRRFFQASDRRIFEIRTTEGFQFSPNGQRALGPQIKLHGNQILRRLTVQRP